MRIGKSRCIESDRTCCCTGKFNVVLSLYRVLGVTLYFSEDFLEAATRVLAVTEILWLLGVTMAYFLGQQSNLWSFALQQRHKLFLRCLLHLSLVIFPLLASLEERSICRELDCFLEADNRDSLEEDALADKTAKDRFVLF